MFHDASPRSNAPGACDMVSILQRLSGFSRPRYAFMLLNLIAQVAGPDGSAGPWIVRDGKRISLRDWLCDALAPMAVRETRRSALIQRVRADLLECGELPADPVKCDAAIDQVAISRARVAGKSNLSRAVSELVAAGLLRRHYEGYRVDHHNRGGQRHAVYTLIGASRRLSASASQPERPVHQAEFDFAF
ncbi:hypothetical protein J3E64_003677 [Sphingobium sp. OAS761]|uniref:hypothetical protein n=1 Tax=Sphingobium sp. OAS761 TaxID=2817901 RepID=UPI00209E90B1|nr:hypothetical protein [Sphingobium sp. OAS761]MCP1471962.1 hypothetical protein [Sphingobium sp. OAS761]